MRNFLWSQGMDGEGESDGGNEIWLFIFSLQATAAPVGVSWSREWWEIIQHSRFMFLVFWENYWNLLLDRWSVLAVPSLLHRPGKDCDMTCLLSFVLLCSCVSLLSKYDKIWHEITWHCGVLSTLCCQSPLFVARDSLHGRGTWPQQSHVTFITK